MRVMDPKRLAEPCGDLIGDNGLVVGVDNSERPS